MVQLKLKKVINNGFTFLMCLTLLLGCNKVRIENYFIPKDFTGNVAIIYGDKKASSENVYNYVIPKDGILNTERTFRKGDFRINFYQQNEAGSYDTLFEELPGKRVDVTKNRIYFNKILTFKKDKKKEIIVNTFYIGKVKSSDLGKDNFLFERQLEKIVLGN